MLFTADWKYGVVISVQNVKIFGTTLLNILQLLAVVFEKIEISHLFDA